MTGEPTSKERNGTAGALAINYHLKSEVSSTFCCQLCSTCYTTLRIKNCLKSTSAIKVATMKNNEGKPSSASAKLTPFCSQQR